MEIPISLTPGDTTKATQEIAKAAEEAGEAVEKSFTDSAQKGEQAFDNAGQGISSSMEKAKGGIVAAGAAMAAFAAGAVAAYGSVKALSGIIDTVQGQTDVAGRAKFFGATSEQAEMLRGKLDDVKSSMEATALAAELASGGFNSIDMARFADGVNAISALTGATKESVEDMLKAGELSEEALRVLGKTRQEADLVLAKASAAAGGRELDNLEKARVLMRAFGSDIQRVNNNLGSVGRSNPFNVLAKDIQTMWEQVTKSLRPALDDLVKTISDNRGAIVGVFKAAAKAVILLTRNLAIATKAAQKAGKFFSEYYRDFFRLFKSNQQKQAEAIERQLAREVAQRKAHAQKLAKQAKTAEKKIAKAAAKAEAETRNAAEEAKLHERLAAAEAGIQAGREKAMSNVRSLAAETAEAIVEKLSGQAPTRAEVDAAIARNAA